MPLKLFSALAAACVATTLAMPHVVLAQPSPFAQNGPSVSPPGPARRRIEIYPRPLLYRRCIDWYEIQHRPSGTVLYPQMRCWWVRG